MKELYIAPELEILCFAPMEELAAQPEWVTSFSLTGSDSSLSLGEVDGDIHETLTPSEGLD